MYMFHVKQGAGDFRSTSVYLLCFGVSLIDHVRVDQRDQRRADDRYEEEPEGGHASEERPDEGEYARDHEQC